MPDIFTKEKRSWVMSRIRGKNTRPELFVEEVLKAAGVQFEKHPKMDGNPDFVVRCHRVIIFADGDFWHGYRMGPKRMEKMNEFWRDKITRNKERDRKVNAALRRGGWKVVRIWEHDIRKRPNEVMAQLLESVKVGSSVSAKARGAIRP